MQCCYEVAESLRVLFRSQLSTDKADEVRIEHKDYKTLSGKRRGLRMSESESQLAPSLSPDSCLAANFRTCSMCSRNAERSSSIAFGNWVSSEATASVHRFRIRSSR